MYLYVVLENLLFPMWNIREVVSNPVNARRNNICWQSSTPSLLCIIYIIIYGFISWAVIQVLVLWSSIVQKKNEQIRVLADDCTRTRYLPLHYKKNYSHVSAISPLKSMNCALFEEFWLSACGIHIPIVGLSTYSLSLWNRARGYCHSSWSSSSLIYHWSLEK